MATVILRSTTAQTLIRIRSVRQEPCEALPAALKKVRRIVERACSGRNDLANTTLLRGVYRRACRQLGAALKALRMSGAIRTVRCWLAQPATVTRYAAFFHAAKIDGRNLP